MTGGGAVAKALCAALACLLGLGALALGVTATAQEMTFFRIGTGGVAGTYYPSLPGAPQS